MSETRFLARLAARLHDPPEKALVLLRTRKGHEGGTVRTLLAEAFPDGVPPDRTALLCAVGRQIAPEDVPRSVGLGKVVRGSSSNQESESGKGLPAL